MNIKIPHSWLTEYLKTDASPREIANSLSLCSASVEHLEKVNNDYIYDVEVTTNRVDMLSIYGLAREASAALPRFGFKADLLSYPQGKHVSSVSKDNSIIKVRIENPKLCPRFTAVLISNISVKNSPEWIRDRLEKSGVRSLNNVVDIGNYAMLETGYPMHTFDYDKIKGRRMVMRESKSGESIVTLDGMKRNLPEGTIVIEDEEKRLIDLCGIMGGLNSAVNDKTKRVLLFVQTYDPSHIRRACQQLSFRTDAATRFEKGIDTEGIFSTLERAVRLFTDLAAGHVEGRAIDIYSTPHAPKIISVPQEKIKRMLGINISSRDVESILSSLQFGVESTKQTFNLIIPTFRAQDINIPEDIVEEVARIYGYHNLPNLLPEGQIPTPSINWELSWEKRIKYALKYWGFTETYSYSLVGKELLEKVNENPKNELKLQNPLNFENEYLRPYLLPSLLEIVAKNQNKAEKPLLFELSMAYEKQKNGMLPDEKPKLAIVITGGDYFNIKGVVEQLFVEVGRPDFEIRTAKIENMPLFDSSKTACLIDDIGYLGEIKSEKLLSFGIRSKVSACELDCKRLFAKATTKRAYNPPSVFPSIIEDLTFIKNRADIFANEIVKTIRKIEELIVNVEILTVYKNTLTFRLSYQSRDKTLTNREIEVIRLKIVKTLEAKFQLTLKGKVQE